MKKRKTRTTGWYKKKLWSIFTKYIKHRDKWQCFTCGKFVTGRNANGGHFISAAVCPPTLYFHEKNVHCQCVECNLRLEGNHYVYGVKLGKRTVNLLNNIKRDYTGEVWSVEDYKLKIKEYEGKLRKLIAN